MFKKYEITFFAIILSYEKHICNTLNKYSKNEKAIRKAEKPVLGSDFFMASHIL